MEPSDPIVIYLAGPMAGLPEFNVPAFDAAAKRYREAGYAVLSPADHFRGQHDLPRPYYLRRAIHSLLDADIVVFLPGWEESDGAKWERVVAQELGLGCIIDVPGEETRPAEYLSRSGMTKLDAFLREVFDGE